jgi:hypothetical protein
VCRKDSRWWWWRTRPLWTRRANWCVHCVESAKPHQTAILTHMSSHRAAGVEHGRRRCRPKQRKVRATCRDAQDFCRTDLCQMATCSGGVIYYCMLFSVAGCGAGTGFGCGFARRGRAAACCAVLVDGRLGTLLFPGLSAGAILHFCRMRLDARKPFSGTCQCRVACRDERVSDDVKRAAPRQPCTRFEMAQRVSPALEGRLAHRAGVDVDTDSTLFCAPLVLDVTCACTTRSQRTSERRAGGSVSRSTFSRVDRKAAARRGLPGCARHRWHRSVCCPAPPGPPRQRRRPRAQRARPRGTDGLGDTRC